MKTFDTIAQPHAPQRRRLGSAVIFSRRRFCVKFPLSREELFELFQTRQDACGTPDGKFAVHGLPLKSRRKYDCIEAVRRCGTYPLR